MADRRVQLRGGAETADRRLDRLPELDPRSRDYPVRRHLAADTPIHARVWRLLRSLMGDQGREGACVEFGLLHVLACLPVAQALAVLRAIRGEHLIYWPAQHDDPWPGGEYPGASPREGGTSETTAMRFLKAVGVISEFSWAFDFDAAVQGVVNVGPANLALAWTDGMMEASREGLIRDQGPVVGGHDVAWIGVQPGKRIDGQRIDVAVIAQSWGLDYGDRGRVYLPLDDLARRVADDGTVAFLHGEQRIDLDRLRQAASAVLAR
jgi:hypothetical protein